MGLVLCWEVGTSTSTLLVSNTWLSCFACFIPGTFHQGFTFGTQHFLHIFAVPKNYHGIFPLCFQCWPPKPSNSLRKTSTPSMFLPLLLPWPCWPPGGQGFFGGSKWESLPYTTIWANNYKSLTWMFRPFWGSDSLTIHYLLGVTNQVAINCLEQWLALRDWGEWLAQGEGLPWVFFCTRESQNHTCFTKHLGEFYCDFTKTPSHFHRFFQSWTTKTKTTSTLTSLKFRNHSICQPKLWHESSG